MISARVLAPLLILHAAIVGAADNDKPSLVDAADPRDWPAYGRTASEARFSPLDAIQRDTVSRLRLAWALNLDVSSASVTPLAVGGILYVAAGYSIVHAVDAKTGKVVWRWDSEAVKQSGTKLRKGWGVRGLAFAQGRLFVGTHDGRLVALDAKKGTVVWTAATLPPNDTSYISGAPRVLNGKVIIGFGGAETIGVRGYVTAYDALTGQQAWRFYTVPEGASGGGVWNGITVDPELNRVYLGVGNAPPGAPTTPRYLNSIVALDANSGAYAWHYQTTPDNLRSYDAANDITLATLLIDGSPRKVLLQAPKNGFFYVIDRVDGKFISAQKVTMVNWATRIDPSGKAVLAPASDGPEMPGSAGAHGVSPQSFSPRTGLVYLPTIENPRDPKADVDAPGEGGSGYLTAWDPAKQRAAWQIPTPGPFNGGSLATGGDLVFHGQADGYINGFDAASGRKLWSFYAASAALGSPISFAAGGKQYIAIVVGPPSGVPGNAGEPMARFHWDYKLHPRRLLAFTLDGTAQLPATPSPTMARPLDGPEVNVDAAVAKQGQAVYARCRNCHGAGAVAAGNAPDLRTLPSVINAASFATIVRGGLETRGMPAFAEITDGELESLRQFIRERARLVTRPDGVAPPPPEEAPAPTKEAEQPAEPQKPPGSLESTPPPQ